MAKSFLTTNELLDDYFLIATEVDYLESEYEKEEDKDKKSDLQTKLDVSKTDLAVQGSAILTKANNIEYVKVSKELSINKIDAEIQVVQGYLNSLRANKNSMVKAWEYMCDLLGDLIGTIGKIDKNGNKFITNELGRKFTLGNKWGELEILNTDAIPQSFYKMEVKVDKARLRKAIINGEDGLEDCATVNKRRTIYFPRKKVS